MRSEFPGDDFDEQWQGALELRSMAAEVRSFSAQNETLRGRRRLGPLGRRLRRAAKGAAYLVAAAALFSGGWFARALADSPAAASPGLDEVSREIIPEEGVTLDVRWGDVPAKLREGGVLDLEKFKAAARTAGMPLTEEQISLLTEGSDDRIRVDTTNAYFLLDVLWALGLANQNPILTDGPLSQGGKVGSYASTGGWTLGAIAGPTYVASLELLQLTPEQQKTVEDVTHNSFRPCCGNMTGFPDCNHGMAALALAELMASQGASSDEIFRALKQISPYWFPSQYHHLAVYFDRNGRDWRDVSARELMGEKFSSARGFQQVSAQLQQQGALSGGVGGGKASGCAP